MDRKRIGIFVALLAMICTGLRAQSATNLKINEVLVINDRNCQDDYGLHNVWIEIFDTSFASVDLEGCFPMNDKNNSTKCPIPKGDALTLIKPYQHASFWADGTPNRGTFYVNFTPNPDKGNYIALYDSNGRTLIDKVTIPVGQLADRSYVREKNRGTNWVVKGGGEHSYITPSANNVTIDKSPKIENLKKHDSIGIGMAIAAMSVIFIGLVFLYPLFEVVGNVAIRLGKKNIMKATGITNKTEAREKSLGSRTDEETTAIAMALHEYLNDAHDVEDMILTIDKVKRTYSSWSSKIYTLRQTPGR